jgi:hypothetical protein
MHVLLRKEMYSARRNQRTVLDVATPQMDSCWPIFDAVWQQESLS